MAYGGWIVMHVYVPDMEFPWIPSPITHLQGHQPLLIDPRHPKTKQRFLVVCLTMYIYTVKNMMAVFTTASLKDAKLAWMDMDLVN